MSKSTLLVLMLVAAMIVAACAPAPAPAPAAEAPAAEAPAAEAPAEQPAAAPAVKELKMLWAQWDPADYLQQIGNMYEKETGIKVPVVQEPGSSFGDRLFTEMAAGGDAGDMVVGDSQLRGQGAPAGPYVHLTDFLVRAGMSDDGIQAALAY